MIDKLKRDLRALTQDELREQFKTLTQPAYRADQVYDWLWSKEAHSIDDMLNLPKALRESLKAIFEIRPISVSHEQVSKDGTIKNAVRLADGLIVESVLIPTDRRITACISSQVGCNMGCHFCATAKLKRIRNLSPGEIVDQVRAIQAQAEKHFKRPLTNIVYMGMGAPLANYHNVLASIERITSPKGLGISAKRITLSTVGLPKLIRRMADEQVKFNLAVSLHSARDEVRSAIMPVNDASNVKDLMDSMLYWYEKTGSQITIEYVVWKDLNDGPEDIQALVALCKRVPSKVNLIEYNSIGDGRFQKATLRSIDAYVGALEHAGVTVNIRRSRGKDIDAACGQLANKSLPESMEVSS
jgi:23S rRNA (adenine2503-C2)-methyltransferase